MAMQHLIHSFGLNHLELCLVSVPKATINKAQLLPDKGKLTTAKSPDSVLVIPYFVVHYGQNSSKAFLKPKFPRILLNIKIQSHLALI